MNQIINKDIMLDVLIEQNSDLNKLVKVQEKQIKTYKELAETYRSRDEDYRERQKAYEESKLLQLRVEDNVKALIKSYEDQIGMLKNTLEVQHKYINELNAKVEELQGGASSNDSSG